MNHRDTHQQFIERCRELTDLQSILSSLSWDQETMMPPQAAAFRARQSATLARLYHQKLIDPALRDLLDRLETAPLDDWGRASVREMRRQYDRATKLPSLLVSEMAETASLAYEAWVEARRESNFDKFAPWLEKTVRLKREQARCLAANGSLYDALLDEYEPGVTEDELKHLFGQVQPQLSALLEQIARSPHQPDRRLLEGSYPICAQEALGRDILSSMGFAWEAGRLDTSPHPFCTGLSPRDVRITTRYSEEDFSKSLFGVIHEGGHALYEQGLELQHYGMPACESISLGIHESQSRLWENIVGRGRPFWEFWYPRLNKAFQGRFDEVGLDRFLHAINLVTPSYIRVDADEVSYGLHVILRFDLERGLLAGELETADIRQAWNERMESYLGLRPRNDAEGVLQDTHWSQGLIGYFPTYLLGTMYASQFYNQARRDMPDLEARIRAGELLPLREWLGKHIHRKGKLQSAAELVRDLTGEPLDPNHFLGYLRAKFGRLYRL